MDGITVNFNLTKVPQAVQKAMRKAMEGVGLRVCAEAKANAPVSPTEAELDREYERTHGRKSEKKRKQSVRYRRRKHRATPGGLEKSIRVRTDARGACIYVPRSDPAGAYAHYIHDMKNVLWYRRGIGTRRKGDRADEKFIDRAIKDNVGKINATLQAALDKAMKGATK